MKKKIVIFLTFMFSLFAILPNVRALDKVKERNINMYVLANTTTSSTVANSNSSTQKNNIVKETNVCDGTSLSKLLNKYWRMVLIFMPPLLILMVSIDFFKAIVSGDADKIRKSSKDALNRTLAFVILLLLPFILSTIFGWVGLTICL